MANLNEHERQINALWAKVEELKNQAYNEKLADVEWKTKVQTKLETKIDYLERFIWAILTITVLAVVAIAIQYAFDFIKRGGM